MEDHFWTISGSRFIIDLLYAGSHNLFEYPIYQKMGITKAYVHRDMQPLLRKLDTLLEERELYLVIYDAYRPLAAQREMWAILPVEGYVAHPEKGSKHNRGSAIDCYLLDAHKRPFEFPTAIDGYYPGCRDDFNAWLAYLSKAHRDYICAPEEQDKCRNRDMFRNLMETAGFISHPKEWWHYELPNGGDYPLMEIR